MGSVAGRKLSVFCMENCLEKCKFWSWPFGQLFSPYRIRASKAMAAECAVTRTQIFNFQSFLADDIEQKPKV